MEIRSLVFSNHYWEIKTEQIQSDILGNFCAFGYFDAMDFIFSRNRIMSLQESDTTESKDEAEGEESKYTSTWEAQCDVFIRKAEGKARINSLSLGIDRDFLEMEEMFWRNRKPFLFISLIRAKNVSEALIGIRWINEKEKGSGNEICYYSYEHCEACAMIKTSTYAEGIQAVRSLYEEFDALKIYTIFTVAEKDLDQIDQQIQLGEEYISVRLSAVVLDWEKIEEYMEALENALQLTPGQLKVYDTLGEVDLLIEIDDVKWSDLLKLYKMGNLLTHNNELYQKALRNLETKFIIKRKRKSDETDGIN